MSNKNYYHNKGQQDQSEGKYEPPKGNFDDKEAYDLGREVTKAQQEANEGKYAPPANPGILATEYQEERYEKEKAAYDKSWENTKRNTEK